MAESAPGQSPGNRIRALARGLSILDVLAAYPGGATPKTIAAELRLNVSTVYHLLNTLVAAEHAVRAPDSRLFFLGPRVAHLHAALVHAFAVPPRLRDLAAALRQATGDTTTICQWWGDEVLCTVLLESTRDDGIKGGYVGIVCPAQWMATGKVLLAWVSPGRVDAYLARNSGGPYEHLAAPPPADVRGDLTRIRRTGYALDRDLVGVGACCVAAPVFGAAGQVDHALGVIVPRRRFEADEATVVETVLGIARAASAARQADAGAAGAGSPSHRAGAAPLLPRLG